MLSFVLQWPPGTPEGISPVCCGFLGVQCDRGGTFGSQPSFMSSWDSIQSLWHWYLNSDIILSPQKGPLTSVSLSMEGWGCAPNLCGAELMNVCEALRDERQQAENFISSQTWQARLKWAWKQHSPFCCTSVKQTWIKRHANSGVKKKKKAEKSLQWNKMLDLKWKNKYKAVHCGGLPFLLRVRQMWVEVLSRPGWDKGASECAPVRRVMGHDVERRRTKF